MISFNNCFLYLLAVTGCLLSSTVPTVLAEDPPVTVITSCLRRMDYLNNFKIKTVQNITVGPSCHNILIKTPNIYNQNLIQMFRQYGPGSIGLPIVDYEMSAWAEVSRLYPVAVSPPKSIPMLVDKIKFKAFVAQLGYGQFVPRRYRSIASVKYPCVVKRNPELGAGGLGVAIVHNEDEFKLAMGELTIAEALVEEFIGAKSEIYINVVGYKGKVISLEECTKVEIDKEDVVITGRGSTKKAYPHAFIKCRDLPKWEAVKSLSEIIVENLSFNGIGFIQLRYTAAGEPKFVEMNGRVDGWIRLHNHTIFSSLLQLYIDTWTADTTAKLIHEDTRN